MDVNKWLDFIKKPDCCFFFRDTPLPLPALSHLLKGEAALISFSLSLSLSPFSRWDLTPQTNREANERKTPNHHIRQQSLSTTLPKLTAKTKQYLGITMDSSRSINVLSCRESQYCLDDHIFVAYLKEKFDPTFEFNLSVSNDSG